jgi:hypothetical protein
MRTHKCRQNLPSMPFSRLDRMPRLPHSPLALGLGAVAVLALASCGGEDARLLPGETAREITANLDTVRQLSDEGDCVGAESAAQQVGEQIEAIEGVDRQLKRALEDGAARLEEVIASCEESTTEAIAPAAIPGEDEEEAEEKPAKGKEKKEKEAKSEEEEAAPATPPPALPPQAKGEGKGLENGNGPPASEEEGVEEGPDESQSGGVAPGAPAGGGK